jgi:hypothetical protein
MKTPIFLITLAMAFVSGCKKDSSDGDKTPPVITIAGQTDVLLDLNSGAYSDPGATASDNQDGVIHVSSDFSSTNPNPDEAGLYSIKYTATDKSGNTGTAVRTVIVRNTAEDFAGEYTVTQVLNGVTTTYSQTITVDKNINNRIHFSRFGNYENSHVYADKLSTGDLLLPVQASINIGTDNGNPCDVVNHSFQSTGYSGMPGNFTLIYSDLITAPGSCQSAMTGSATYVR